MDTTQILPKLDFAVLQEKANEFAMKGAIKCLEDFYSGYDSPYRKAITEELKKKDIGGIIEIPDIIALINDSLAKEVEIIANTAVSKTFIPLIKKSLTRAEKEMNFSDVLKQFIECTDATYGECSVEIERHTEYNWLNIELSFEDQKYNLVFHEDYDSKKAEIKKYRMLSLPRDNGKYNQTMKLSVADGMTLELPYTREVLQDKFIAFIASMVIADTKITMDCEDFDEEMFPEECHC